MEYTINRLRKALGGCSKEIAMDIDENLRPIITELNERNYFTIGCCEGHNPYFLGYIAFKKYAVPNMNQFPLLYTCTERNQYTFIEWNECDEKRKVQILNEILEWAQNLPIRERKHRIAKQIVAVNSKGNPKKCFLYYDDEDMSGAFNEAKKGWRYIISTKEWLE